MRSVSLARLTLCSSISLITFLLFATQSAGPLSRVKNQTSRRFSKSPSTIESESIWRLCPQTPAVRSDIGAGAAAN
jgi:hypothetical protein